MDCKRSNDLMSLALDQVLTKEATTEFEAHLEGCKICKEDYQLYQSINTDLTRIGTEVELPDGFHKTLMNRINTKIGVTGEEVPVKVIPFWRHLNRRTMNVAAMFVLVVVFALIGVKSLNNIGVSDESAVMNEMPEMEMAKEEADYGSGDEKAAPKMMDAEIASESLMTMNDEASADGFDIQSDALEGGTEENLVEQETLTMRMTEASVPVADGEPTNPEATLSITGTADEPQPQLARTEEAEVTSYKATDHGDGAIGEVKSYTGLGTSKGHEILVLLIFGGFIAVTGIGGIIILKRAK